MLSSPPPVAAVAVKALKPKPAGGGEKKSKKSGGAKAAAGNAGGVSSEAARLASAGDLFAFDNSSHKKRNRKPTSRYQLDENGEPTQFANGMPAPAPKKVKSTGDLQVRQNKKFQTAIRNEFQGFIIP